MTANGNELRRSLGLWALIIYGVGDILGAGIYALVGEIAGIAGYASWLSFLIAMVVAALTALSYAELSGRLPHSGGASYYCQEAFRREGPALLVGWLVLCSGVVSMAVLSLAFAGYVTENWPVIPWWLLIIGFLLGLGLINFLGIEFSSATNILCTAMEVSGLVIVIVGAAWFLSGGGGAAAAPANAGWPGGLSVLQGAALAFFAFVGFEDLANVAEEAKRPERDLPLAMLAALACASVVYLAVVSLSVLVIPPEVLQQSDAPLLNVVRKAAPVVPGGLFALIALFAVANSALLNSVMASRLLYGMSRQRLLPHWLSFVHARRQSPYVAIILVFTIALVLALSGTIKILGGTTSVLLLAVFLMVHLSLIVLKWTRPAPESGFQVPVVLPVLGVLSCLGLIFFVPPESLVRGSVVLAAGLLIVVFYQVARAR